MLPRTPPLSDQRYPALLRGVLRLLREEPELRRSSAYQAMIFAAFSAAWTTVALLMTGPHYGLGADAVGLIAFVGAAVIPCTRLIGRAVDRHGPGPLLLACVGIMATGAAVLTLAMVGGAPGLIGLAAGLLLLELGIQCGHIANQTRVFSLRPEARSRLNTAFMTCAFLGGSTGSWVGVRAYSAFGWLGVCALVATLALAALALHCATQGVPGARRVVRVRAS